MLFSDVTNAFARIESTASRRQTSTLLAGLFAEPTATPDDARILTYLLQGRLGPPYAAPNFGLDTRRLADAIARASGEPVSRVWTRFKDVGDLGVVAAELLPPVGEPISLADVFADLLQLAETSGSGSADEKVERFARLLALVGGPGDRYLARIAAGTLRLGVGDATIVEALALASGGRTAPSAIERAYSLCSDLGLVAERLLRGGEEALAEIHPEPGRPVLPALAERLPSSEEIIRKLGEVVAEPKYDGLRLQAQRSGERIWLFTRRLEDIGHAFPNLAQGLRQQVRADAVILDGEVIGFDPRTGTFLPFQQTARRRRKHQVGEIEEAFPVRYYVFDILYREGRDLTSAPYAERLEILRESIHERPNGPVFLTPRQRVHTPEELDQFVAEMLSEGMEGAVVKNLNAPYHAGSRDYAWVKLKREYQRGLADTFDLVVVGYERGQGRRASLGIGSVLCCVYDPQADQYRTLSWVGSGLTDAQWIQLREALDAIRVPDKPASVDSLLVPDVWVEPRYVVEVLAGGITRSPRHTCGKVDDQPGFALRFPRVVQLRLDRRPEDATTQSEVLEMYQIQEQQSGTAGKIVFRRSATPGR